METSFNPGSVEVVGTFTVNGQIAPFNFRITLDTDAARNGRGDLDDDVCEDA